ncbi:MAG: hypothetical protein RBG1_1C00001G1324 [candidate division Zixibacteria bacterium RBG-1]|nr:MAG: hypothetical protein RBG1_1C00001G1324 [candidate division Zixibacteria bacterium RBG-1]
MQLALKLAQKGLGKTSPNPMVGTVIVKNGKIIGSGYHRMAGDRHAEVIALQYAGKNSKSATLYVNLEPCCHFGQTPPCTEEIINSGIKKVVCAMIDPNPKVKGKGIEILKKNKIKIEVGLLEEEAKKLNEAYIKYMTTGLPFVILKWASTLDGKIATVDGDSKWISNDQSRKFAHKLRSQVDAVLVGVDTMIKDDPELNTRLVKGKNPVKIILDTKGRMSLNSKIVSNAKSERTILATVCADKERFENSNLEVWKLKENQKGQVDLLSLLKKTGENKITSILIEGGQKVLTSFMQEKLVDKVYCFIAPKIIGKGLDAVAELGIRKISDSVQLKNVEIKKIEDNVLISGYPVWRN